MQDSDDLTKELLGKFAKFLENTNTSKFVTQTGDDVAKCILKAMEDEKPHLHYLTHESLEETMKKKYVDISGDSIVQIITQQFF